MGHKNIKLKSACRTKLKLKLFSFHHLNLAYSAISEKDRAKVLDRCYWPLLRLARKLALPFGIEITGYTLEEIGRIDPSWIAELRSLINDGNCEFIGSGYAQIIGPLVPDKVNHKNLMLGTQVYQEILGVHPKLALINEQAYSAGLLPIYKYEGYEAIIMEWNNPYKSHPEWDPEWRYCPQLAKGTSNTRLSLIWNKSITFQKFQRYAHGEIALDEFLSYLNSHLSMRNRALCLYGNDVEIFDFRPARYKTEAPICDQSEWERIEQLYAAINNNSNYEIIAPSGVLKLLNEPAAGNVLELQSAAYPIPVKKQDKYNVTRWAVTGRNDLDINTRCWKIYNNLERESGATDSDWRELCYLWGSDFRTHITKSRWEEYLKRLKDCEQKWKYKETQILNSSTYRKITSPQLRISRSGRFLDIEGSRLRVRFNCLKGLAIESFTDMTVAPEALIGTVGHGYYDDISWSADYYSGHLIFEPEGHGKVTDLAEVKPIITRTDEGENIFVSIPTLFGVIEKNWLVKDSLGEIVLTYKLNWTRPVLGSLRLAFLTLLPDAFDRNSMFYETKNGGNDAERFQLAKEIVDHGKMVSTRVSASHALGITDGTLKIGDSYKNMRLCFRKDEACLVGMISYRSVLDRIFARIVLSAKELDETAHESLLNNRIFTITYCASQTS